MISTEISPTVRALVDALVSVSPGELITYRALSAAIGQDVREVSHLLLRARDIAGRDHGALYGTERGVGYVRLTTEQLPGVGATLRASVRRRTRRVSSRLSMAASRVNDMPAETARKINAELSVLGLLNHLSGDKRAEPAAAHDHRPEPVAITARRLLGEFGPAPGAA